MSRRARAIVEAFRPLRGPVDAVVTAFGSFPGVPRNATADIVRELAASGSVALQRSRVSELSCGRGALPLPSGRSARVSLMILPVAWEAAGALVVKEARATRASLVLMNGVAGAAQPIFVEEGATNARMPRPDAFGARPRRARSTFRTRPATLDVDVARDALARSLDAAPIASVPGAVIRLARADNAYVCNATAWAVASAPRLAARHGFFHWPKDIPVADVPACARALAALLDALL